MRKRPYTAIGIVRVPCARCGNPSRHQWNACSLSGQYFGVCTACDIGLNRVAIEYIGFPDAQAIIAAYIARIEARSGETQRGSMATPRKPDQRQTIPPHITRGRG